MASVEGRAVETIYDTQHRPISPFAVNDAVRHLQDVMQCQFVQRGPGSYLLRLVPLGDLPNESEARSRFLSVLGDDAHLDVSLVEDIPPLPSGKRPYVINEWAREKLLSEETERTQ